ncbi:MAG: heavy metal translocating P-type ATPase [Pseudomonadota bacterium]
MSCCAATAASPEQIAETKSRLDRLEEERLRSASVDLGDGRYKTDFIVPDMHCAGCIGAIERGLASHAPVQQVRANLSMKTVSVIWNAKRGDGLKIAEKLEQLGFEHHLSGNNDLANTETSASKSLLLALAVAGFAAANIMLLSVSVWSGADEETAILFHLISGLIAVPTVAFSGQPFFKSALKALSAKRLNMDVPISLAVLLALGMSIYESLTGGEEAYFDASVTLLFFLLIGKYLDQLMRQKARGAVERLHTLSAKDGVLVGSDEELHQIPLADIKTGMRLRIFPGERFPVNAKIIRGNSNLDRSHVTGESEQVEACTGDTVEAGTLNLTSVLDVTAIATAEDSFLGEMRQMMEVAEQGRGNYVRVADRMAQIYAPAVHLLALLTFVAWMFVTGGDWHPSLYTAIAVLIITCPCALGLAVPVAHVIGANRLMRNGILMRDGTALERLAEVDSIIFDKTGTLTTASPAVVSVHGYDESISELLKTLAVNSSHPCSKAVDKFLDSSGNTDVAQLTEHPGLGLEAVFEGKTVRFGKPEWVAEISADREADLETYSISFAVEGSAPFHFIVSDSLREDAVVTVENLTGRNLQLEILSGDRFSKVSEIARKVGIDRFFSGQAPAEKIDRINAVKLQGRKVLMIGDGINDAPSLAASHVSMVPASASDVGRQSADLVFVRESLGAVPFALDISSVTARIVRQNFGIAIAYNCIAVPLAMLGHVTPLVAAIAMSASSIVVVANSFRINVAKAGIEKPAKQLAEENGEAQMEFVQ